MRRLEELSRGRTALAVFAASAGLKLLTASLFGGVHVAAATVAGAHLLLSWNFKDLVRYDRIRMFNGVNAIKGYHPVDIRSPLEVSYGGREEGLCVEMKREAQRRIRAEYEARKDEFASYSEFLNATVGESIWGASIVRRFSRAKGKG